MKRCRECSAVENDEVEDCAACGGRDWVPEPPMVVDDRYEVVSKIGRGSMGIVYRARDIGLGRDVALKVIAPMYARDPGMVDRFRREARALATIRHDNVVQVYAAGSHGRSLYFAMEFVAGLPLSAILASYHRHGEMPPVDRAVSLLSMIGQGLAAAHEKGLVHRDVKPGNIIVEQDTGRPIVIDFGLVHQPKPGSDAKTMRSGTPSYMAPEQSRDVVLHSDALSPATDVYALGCTAFELLTGTPPFSAADISEIWRQHVSAPPPTLASLRPELAPLDGPVGRALQKDPAARYPTCEGFARALRKAAAGLVRDGTALAHRPAARASTTSLAGALLRVLLVDDDVERVERLSRATRAAAGAVATTIDVASDAAQAEAEVGRAPDVIVVNADVLGPATLPLLTWLRDQPDGGGVRIVVTTAGEPAPWRYDLFGVRDVLSSAADESVSAAALRGIGERLGWAR